MFKAKSSQLLSFVDVFSPSDSWLSNLRSGRGSFVSSRGRLLTHAALYAWLRSKVLTVNWLFFVSYRGELERAENLLCEAYKVYKHERWTLLATKCLVKLAQCQKQLRHMDQYPFKR